MMYSARRMVLDDPPDAVVGQAAVEGVDQLGGGEVADSVAGVDRGVTQSDQHVAFAGAGGADQHRVLAGADPFQGGQVVEGGGRDRRGGDVELVEAFGDREVGGLVAGSGVGGVAAGDLGFDEGAQEVLWAPALGFGRDQQFGGDGSHGGQLQAAQTGDQVGGQRRRGGRGHRGSPMA